MSTMATIHDNKDKIPASLQVTTRWMRSRSLVMENMEQLLSVWIEDQNQQNVLISVVLIQEKARSLSQDLKREQGEGAKSETFGASGRWFGHFTARHNLPILGASSEASGPGVEEAHKYTVLLCRVIREGSYTAWQVFNVDETGLFWKRLPDRTSWPPASKWPKI